MAGRQSEAISERKSLQAEAGGLRDWLARSSPSLRLSPCCLQSSRSCSVRETKSSYWEKALAVSAAVCPSSDPIRLMHLRSFPHPSHSV
jgi:hypothetical protein